MRLKTAWILIGLLALLIAGCREQAAPAKDTLNIAVYLPEAEPTVGETQLEVIVSNTQNNASVDGATVSVRGDMTHPGMIPVIAETNESSEGSYLVPFEWTMGGEWIVTVTVTLPDGTTANQEFEYVVKTGG
jgi:hypothetical protein